MLSTQQMLSKVLHKLRYDSAKICQRYLDRYNGYSYDFFKNGESDLLIKLVSLNPKIVFDVGANVGDWSAIAHQLFPAATIHCFELSEKTFNTLRGNIDRIPFVLNNVGLSDTVGFTEYKDYGENSGVNTILHGATYHDKAIQPQFINAYLSTGDEYCRSKNISVIDFLKIDVEGAEHLVLQGCSELLGRKAIRAIQFEYGYTNGDSKFLMRDFHRFFNDHGYIVARINKGPILFKEWKYKDNDFTSGLNYVAVRKNDSEIVELLSN